MIVTGGVQVNAVASEAGLERALQYGNHSSVTEHLPVNLGENRRRRQASKMLS